MFGEVENVHKLDFSMIHAILYGKQKCRKASRKTLQSSMKISSNLLDESARKCLEKDFLDFN